jgi:hypothetical protein
MSHEIKENDKAYRPDYTAVSWHGLEEAIPGPIVSKEQIPFVAYPVAKRDLLLPAGYQLSSTNCSQMIVGYRPESPIIIATCSPEYQVIGNDIIFEKALEAFTKAGIPVDLSFCLTMDNGKKYSYAFAVKGSEEFNAANGDLTKLFIIVTGSHDKTMGVQIFGSLTRVVCNNTLQMALRGEKKGINHTFFHNQKGVADFQHLPQLVDSIFRDGQRYQALTEQMGNFSLAQYDAFYIASAILANGAKEISTQVYNAANGIAYLFKHGKGNKGVSFYDLLNGVTEFYTTGDGSGKKVTAWAKAISADYGNAAEKKVQFLQKFQTSEGNLISEAEIFNFVNNGKSLVSAYQAERPELETLGFLPPSNASASVGSKAGAFTPLALVLAPESKETGNAAESVIVDAELA